MRNSLLMAPMPTASTAHILGNNECIEPFTSLIYKRDTLVGEFILVNKFLVKELETIGLWTKEIKQAIIDKDGSIQAISAIPENIRELFKTAWDIPQRHVIDMAADRAPYICQSQSLNIFLARPTNSNLSSMHFYGWKKGLKTGSYYIRAKPAAKGTNVTSKSTDVCLTCSS